MRRVSSFFFLFFFSLFSSSLFAAFKDAGWGVRPEGMGGAFSAIADDSNGVVYNPAGSVLVKKSEFSLAYSKPFVGLGSQVDLGAFYASYVRSVNHHLGFGAAWTNFTSPNLKENSFLLNFSINPGVILKMRRDLIFGFNVKKMLRSFELDDRFRTDPVFSSGNEKDLYSFDFGSWSRPLPELFPEISLAFVLKNLDQPDAGLKTKDLVPMEIVGGIAYQKGFYLLTFELSKRNSIDTYRGGGEVWFFDHKFGVRVGANSSNGSFGLSYRHPFGKRDFFLDYVFVMPFFIQETAGTHRLSFRLRYHKTRQPH